MAAAAAAAALGALPAAAQDFTWSAFGTIGYAQSNRDYHYLRNIDSSGTLRTDSLLGAQGDLRFSPQWSATVQLKLAQSLDSDARWDLTPAWAFLAWRPTDEWLVRAGKMRLPLYLYSESMEIGTTNDMARLPAEMYRLLPSSDFVGLNIGKTWALGARELAVDAFSGGVRSSARFWLRDGAPPIAEPGPYFQDVKVSTTGVVLSLRGPDSALRAGVHRMSVRTIGRRIPLRYPFVEIAPGIGYYQVDDSLPGPGVPTRDSVRNTIYTLGGELAFAPGWRLAAEYARNVQRDTEVGFDSRGGYVAVLHTLGRFTPYASYGALKSSDTTLSWTDRLTQTQLPAFIPGAAQINAAQRIAGETNYAVDQRSFALGTSYRIDAHQKLKFEWLHTRVGRMSRFVDTPAGSESPRNTSIETFSAGYAFSF